LLPNFPEFISKDEWTANSLDLSQLKHHVWAVYLQTTVQVVFAADVNRVSDMYERTMYS